MGLFRSKHLQPYQEFTSENAGFLVKALTSERLGWRLTSHFVLSFQEFLNKVSRSQVKVENIKLSQHQVKTSQKHSEKLSIINLNSTR